MRFPHTVNRPSCHYGPYTAGAKIGTRLVYIGARDVHPVVPCPPAHRNIGRSIDRPAIRSVLAGRTRAGHERLEHCSEFAEAGVEIPRIHVRTVPSLAGRLDP